MDSKLKSIVDKNLYSSMLEIAKTDIVIGKVMENSDNLSEFVNSLMAGIICVTDREAETHSKMVKLLDSDPKVKQIIQNDKTMLPAESSQ